MRFESLREILLRGGVAPRHVRRYLAELSEHLDDLTAQQRQGGHSEEDAGLRARALLGDDHELAAAMLQQKQFRAWTVRAPWLVFGLLPPVVGIAAAFALIAPLAVIARLFHLLVPGGIHAPGWFQTLAAGVTATGNFALAPALAAGFIILAARQRISGPWPLFAILLIAALDLQFQAVFPPPGQRGGSLSIGATTWLLHQQSWLETWPMSLARLLLTLLPTLWLFRKKMIVG